MEMIEDGADNEQVLSETGQAVGVVDVSFSVREAETLVVMGLSGSAKFTLIRYIDRLVEPTQGRVWIDDDEVTALDAEALRTLRRDRLSMVFQNFALFPHMTILDNVAYGLRVQDVEPFNAHDLLIRTEVQDELLGMEAKLQKTIIFITHDLDESLKMGDRIVLMKDGRVIQIGTAEEILREPSTTYVENFVENVDVTEVLSATDIMKACTHRGLPKGRPPHCPPQARASGTLGYLRCYEAGKLPRPSRCRCALRCGK